MASPTTHNPVPPTFTLFDHLPAELQDEIWTYAAATPKLLYLLLQDDLHECYQCYLPCGILPHPESGLRAQFPLSSVCRAAQAAVGRHTKPAHDKTEIKGVIGSFFGPGPRLSFNLDLQNDLVCFGLPDADWKDADRGCPGLPHSDWDEYEHYPYISRWSLTPMAGAVRKFAVRFKSGSERSAGGISELVDGDCFRDSYPIPTRPKMFLLGFCSGCMLRLLRKFEWLDELYFILDEADVQGRLGEGNGDEERRSPSVGREVCTSYSRTYFEVDMSADSAGVGILERLRSKLVRDNQMRRWRLWRKDIADTKPLLIDGHNWNRSEAMGSEAQDRVPYLAGGYIDLTGQSQ
jgi:hypothetical protein